MGQFDIDIDLYFWMIDRGELEDDQRNRVEIEQQKVNLHREHSQRLENAIYIARLMQVIRRTIIKKSKSPFALDPQLNHLKDQSTMGSRQYNWEVVAPELRKFGIKISKENKTRIINGKHSAIQEIVQQLYDYDQAILTYPTVVGNQLKKTMDRGRNAKKGSNNSELNFPLAKASLERVDANVGISPNQKKRRYIQDSEQDKFSKQTSEVGQMERIRLPNSLIQNDDSGGNMSPVKDKKFELSPQSLAQLNASNVLDSNDGLQNVIGFDDTESDSYGIAIKQGSLGKKRSFFKDQKQGKINIKPQVEKAIFGNGKTRVGDSATILEFILDSLGQALGMNSTQAAALIASNQKFLIHLCINGMKGQDFTQLCNWYKVLLQNRNSFVDLLQNEMDDPNALSAGLGVVKCGLYSRNLDVVKLCTKVLIAICQEVQQREASGRAITGFQSSIWDWFVVSKKLDFQSPSKMAGIPPQSPTKTQKDRSVKKQKELETFINESGLRSILRTFRRHSLEFIDSLSEILVCYGSENYIELFTLQLRQNANDNAEFIRINKAVFKYMSLNGNCDQVFIDSGVLTILIDICLSLNDPRNDFNVSLDEKQVSLTFLVEVWIQKVMFIEGRNNQAKISDSIIQVLKRGCDNLSRVIRSTSICLLFYLLDFFAQGRNKFAPVVYKTLTFKVISSIRFLEIREEIFKNFILLFRKFQNIPVAILCEPLLKQVQIYLDKNEMYEQQQPQTILQPLPEVFELNVIDFELFLAIANHPKLDVNTAKQLLEISCLIARKNIMFTRVSLKLVLQILQRFEQNDQVVEHCQQLVIHLIDMIYKQDKQKVQIYQQVKDSPQGRKQRLKDQRDEVLSGTKRDGQGSSIKQKVKISVSPVDTLKETNIKNKKLDDNQIMSCLGPNGEFTAQFMGIKAQEKLIINLIQCIMGCTIDVLVNNIKTQILDTYITIERQLKYINKGLFYLLQLFEKDIGKLLQLTRQRHIKDQKRDEEERFKRLQEKKTMIQEQKETLILMKRKRSQGTIDPWADQSKTLDNRYLNAQAINVQENSSKDTMERASPDLLHGYVNTKQSEISSQEDINEREKKFLLPQIQLNNQESAGYIIDNNRNLAILEDKRKRNFGVRAYSNPTGAQGTLVKRINERSPSIERGDTSQKSGFPFYDINEQSEDEIKWYKQWVQKKSKLYKALFHKYASGSVAGRRVIKPTFDSLKYNSNTMTLTAVHTFIADFKISKLEFAKRDDIKKIVALINIKQQSNTRTISDLDLDGFIQFTLQMGYFMSHQKNLGGPKIPPSQFMVSFFERLKEASLSSQAPLFQGLFDPKIQQDRQPSNDAAILQLLTDRVNMDPNYELPFAYIKIKIDNEMNESEKIVNTILVDLIKQNLDIELNQPQQKTSTYIVERRNKTIDFQSSRQEIKLRQMLVADTPPVGGPVIKDRYKKVNIESSQSLDSINTDVITAIGAKGSKVSRIKPMVTTDDSSNTNSLSLLNKKISPRGIKKNAYIKNEIQAIQPFDRMIQHKRAVSLARHDNRRGVSTLQVSTIENEDSNTGAFWDNMLEKKGQNQLLNSPRPGGRVLNQVQLKQLKSKQQNEEEKRLREERLQKRQATLKRQLEGYQNRKQNDKTIKMQLDKEKQLSLKVQESRQTQIKQGLYQQIREQYNQERLPLLQSTKIQQQILDKKAREEKQKKKQLALAAQKEYTQRIKEDIQEKQQRNKEQEQMKLRAEEKQALIKQTTKKKYGNIKSDYAKGRKNSNSDSNASPKTHAFLERKSVSQLNNINSRNKKNSLSARPGDGNHQSTIQQQNKQRSPRIQSGRSRRSSLSNKSNNQVKLPPVQQEVEAPATDKQQKKGFFSKLF